MDWDALLAQSEALAAEVRVWSARAERRRAASNRCELSLSRLPPRLTHLHPPSPSISQDAHGFPRVERDLAQVERFSTALKERTARVVPDAGADRAAAARLLAAEGVNTRR